MSELIKNRIITLYKDFLSLNEIAKAKNIEVQNYKKEFSSKLNIEENVKIFSTLVTDFTLISRDSQIVFTELFNIIKLYKDLNYEPLSEEIVEFYNKNEVFFPKTLFVVKEDGIVEKEEGIVEREREKFLNGDYLKSLINAES